MATPSVQANLAIPMKLNAFVFNPNTCDGGADEAKIAPITQPNYTFLRIGDFELRSDLLDYADMHNSTPRTRNLRLYDLGTGKMRTNRLGVYLHWMLPRPFRSGAATSPGGVPTPPTAPSDDPSPAPGQKLTPDGRSPTFPNVPNRWMVIRKLDPTAATTQPLTAQQYVQPITAWIVESDRVRKIEDLDDSVDVQVDVSPFLTTLKGAGAGDATGISTNEQAEVFIGLTQTVPDWLADGGEQTDADRVDLNLLNSSNQLFADYQPHNGSVFSMLDRFEYTYPDANGVQQTGYLTDAVADYYVVGWHSDPSDDLLHQLDGKKTKQQFLDSMNMTLNNEDPKTAPLDVTNWLDSPDPERTLCHGALYTVEWHVDWTPPAGTPPGKTYTPTIPANEATYNLTHPMPLAVGTTPMDALLAYAEAHQRDNLEYDLYALSDLLRAQTDSVQARRAGADEMQNYNFSRFGGGSHFVPTIDRAHPGSPPTNPDGFRAINEAQTLLDSTVRAQQQAQWDMFSLWWQYVTDIDNKPVKGVPPIQNNPYIRKVSDLKERIQNMTNVFDAQAKAVSGAMPTLAAKQTALDEFFQPRDPTLFVGGVKPGWPTDYLQKLKVRLDFEITGSQITLPSTISDSISKCLPPAMQASATKLAQEFLYNEPGTTSSLAPAPTDPTFAPLYHDDPDHAGVLRDQWGKTQPWFPLFLEWEAEYYHIPFEDWRMEDVLVRHGKDSQIQYGLKESTTFYPPPPPPSPAPKKDTPPPYDVRTLSGRILILPQPILALSAQIDQLFKNTSPEILDKHLPPERRKELHDGVAGLPFLSSPLDGFTNHLLTQYTGTHLKPTVRVPGNKPLPIADALSAVPSAIGIGAAQLSFIDTESDLTPYGTLVQLGKDAPAFKPVTHGQFHFTKLNVIDKFGQVACAIDPALRDRSQAKPILPCLGDYYEPDPRTDAKWKNWPNIVKRPASQDACEFVQIPPQINQPARLNAAFVVHDELYDGTDTSAYWRPAAEWENPIWGWLVVNYVDRAVQFFLQDGTFYREARLNAPDAPTGSNLPPKWIPYDDGIATAQTAQLDRLCQEFADKAYLAAFIDMASTAIGVAATAPSAYGQFLNSVVGRPLALVNTGWSLELSFNEKKSQSRVSGQDTMNLPRYLLPHLPAEQYSFQLKLGDEERPHDGLVGYFAAKARPSPGDELETGALFTNFQAEKSPPQVHPIDESTYPSLEAFWVDPQNYQSIATSTPAKQARNFCWARNRQLSVFGAIMDPFQAMTAFSAIQPIQQLTLPNWTWESAMKQIHAFFEFGPLVVVDDVPLFDPSDRLTAKKPLDKQVLSATVKLPALTAANWAWLQPYVDETGKPEAFMALSIDRPDIRPTFAKGPYTAIEGYLQMKAPIVDNQPATSSTASSSRV